jgi:alpha-D-xyloside xylohydrolase
MLINTNGFKAYIDPEKMNAYSLLHSQGMYAGQRSATNVKRVVNLTRSSYPGQQRYGTITWSGDVPARWETLRNQLPAGLNFAVTGSPRWTFDIGAFFVKHNGIQWFWDGGFEKGCEDLGYRELFVRWFQLGAFLPMFRAHGTDTPREVWNYGEPGDTMYETLVKFTRLRYRLMPYIYSLAGWETHKDYTMMRSLAFDFRGDPNVYNVGDQFMLGPALMVCPVSEPMYYLADSQAITGKTRQREIYLPDGCDWYDFWTGICYRGGQKISAEAPIERLPLYVKAGSILPFGPVLQHTGQQSGAPVTLWVYPGADGEFHLYDDAGDGYDYEKGEFTWTQVTWNDSTRTLTIGPREGAFQGMPAEQQFIIIVAGEGKSAGSGELDAPDGVAAITGDGSARLSL